MRSLKLQKDGLIRYDRGNIAITDRRGLEERCCECYSVIRQADERLSVAAQQRSRPSPAPRLETVHIDQAAWRARRLRTSVASMTPSVASWTWRVIAA